MQQLKKASGKPGERGQTAVEASFVIIVFFIIVLGSLDLAWMNFRRGEMKQAAREGLREALETPDVKKGEIITKVQEYLTRHGMHNVVIEENDIELGDGNVASVNGNVASVKLTGPQGFFFKISPTVTERGCRSSRETIRQTFRS